MAGVLILGYQIGYRTKGQGGYTEPYNDLPMHRVADFSTIDGFACADVAWQAANAQREQLKQDFPDAEWRIVEVWD